MLNLVQLHIFSCGLTGEGQVHDNHDSGSLESLPRASNLILFHLQARLLLAFPKLSCLPRGDFLCEAVDWVEWLDSEEGTKEAETQLTVQEFHYSEEYHFHTVAQVLVQSKWTLIPFPGGAGSPSLPKDQQSQA